MNHVVLLQHHDSRIPYSSMHFGKNIRYKFVSNAEFWIVFFSFDNKLLIE